MQINSISNIFASLLSYFAILLKCACVNVNVLFYRREVTKSMSKKKEVTFTGSYEEYCEDEDEVYLSSDEESFYEITTSEADSLSSSDNDDSEKLELVIQSAYASSPMKHKLENDPVSRNSLLLWDKDFMELEGKLFL